MPPHNDPRLDPTFTQPPDQLDFCRPAVTIDEILLRATNRRRQTAA
jgi:hypothetical protein